MEVAVGYAYGWKFSRVFRRRMVILATMAFLLGVGGAYSRHNALRGTDIVMALGWAVGVPLVMPLLLALTAKRSERALELQDDGIHTTIGPRSSTVVWGRIAFVREIGAFVIIGGRTGNYFLVPSRAFPDASARARFIAEAAVRTVPQSPRG